MSDIFAGYGRAELERIVTAGQTVRECEQALDSTGDNVVGEIIQGGETFYEWNHYPDGDVYDNNSHSQYFYHAHPQDQRTGEHGHFHTFLRPKGMPKGIKPAPVKNFTFPKDPNDALSHLIAISMDKYGKAIRLFTTNRWVTGEIWYAGDDVVAMLDYFVIGHVRPAWPTNRWIGAMLQLFRPQISALIAERDECVAAWIAEHGSEIDVYEDRKLEITSFRDISAAKQIAAAEKALRLA